MKTELDIIDEVPDLYRIIRLIPFRHTKNVAFDIVPMNLLPRISAIDRVIHKSDAISPGLIGDVERPWYMHPYQDDNLIVLHGIRYVDVYNRKHGNVESFIVLPDRIEKDGEILFDGPAMLTWPRAVFHRIRSGEEGSASLNFAVHHEGFDIRTNFNIYDLNTGNGIFKLIREGYKDQL